MKLYEIPGWADGVKVFRKSRPYLVVVIDDSTRFNVEQLKADDWEPYEEPKQPKKVTLYRPIFKHDDYSYTSGIRWDTNKFKDECIVGWESREVEVRE